MTRVVSHVPMVAGLAYRERLAHSAREFTAKLTAEPDNPHNPRAVAVHGPSGKIGYVSPEIARHCFYRILESGGATCPARVEPGLSPATGVEAILDLTGILPDNGTEP